MKIALVGCAHGELENIYDAMECLEKKENIKIDILLCCGDFQTSRNEQDLKCMAVPEKYYNMCSFYKYYSGESVAPFLTILIGGNHEASNYLQELPYGGWVAPKIYYLGYAGVINIAGVRIAGLSGIYKAKDYTKGHFEVPPYDDGAKRSVYHVRNLEVFRLKQLSQPIDIFLSHDWPTHVTDYGNKEQLIRFKPHFKDDIAAKVLGSKPCEELLTHLKPKYWFSAHLHCKFAALIPHDDETVTKFLALDKCLPKRRFLQVMDIPHNENEEIKIKYDLEWLTTLLLTNHLLSVKSTTNYMPGPFGNQRYCFTPTEEEKTLVLNKLNKDLSVPDNFVQTSVPYETGSPKKKCYSQPEPIQNPQTVDLCEKLSLDDPIEMILKSTGRHFNESDSNLRSCNSNTNIITNDSVSEEASDEQSFINDTIIEENNSKTNRISLSLPEPKNESQDFFFIDTDPWQNKSNLSKEPCESGESDNRISTFDTPTKVPANEGLNDRKIFKRRNINLYKEDN
ncbi:hypothetical protein HHI36_016302 [Cryptolaemus montrouzieri]|uniref:Lariat debranching enzyme C-terminal domain-containing protein n=1 Tax=Cryptolaemus montrouzieri TaxID=559131 RepID=A0ABD2NJ33_9CUCU